MSRIVSGTPDIDRWIGVGRSLSAEAHHAGAEAAAQAQSQAQDGQPAKILIVFCSARHDVVAVLAGVCSVTSDDVVIVGGTSNGEIADAGPGLEALGVNPAVVVTALGGEGFTITSKVVRKASTDRREAGALAAELMTAVDAPHRVLLMIVDGLTRDQHELVRGAYSVLGATIPIVGGCSADEDAYLQSYQFHGSGAGVEPVDDSIVAVGLGSNAPIGIGIAHGWTKSGEPMIVTRSDGGEVLLLDDEPALDAYLRRIGAERSVLDDMDAFRDLALQHPLGMSRRTGEDIRVVHAADQERGSLVCLSDVPQGALVWPMVTDAAALIEAASDSCSMAVQGLGGAVPRGVMVFDCGARKLKLGPEQIPVEQAAIRKFAAGAPVSGFYTYGEIGRTQGSRGMHHLTVVTLALA